MMRLGFVFWAAALAASAQPGVGPPRIGMLEDGAGGLRAVLGVPGNLLMGDPAMQDAVSVAFSGKYGLVKTSASLSVLDADGRVQFSMDVDGGPALFAFDMAGAPAWAYLPETGVLLRWTGTAFEARAVDPPGGDVLAIAEGVFLVQRDGGVWRLDLETGAQNPLPGVHGPVLLQSGGALLYIDDTALVIRGVAGEERRIETGIVIGGLGILGDGWVQAEEIDTFRRFAIRIGAGRELVSQLPEAQ